MLTPKQIDGMNTTLKAIKALGIDIPLRLMALQVKARQNMPVPRAPMVREFLGLAAKPSASDARLLQEGTAAE